MRLTNRVILLLFLLAVVLCHCTVRRGIDSRDSAPDVLAPVEWEIWQTIIEENISSQSGSAVTITYPYDGAVFPPEIAAPTFRWVDSSKASTHWLLVFRFSDTQDEVLAFAETPQWAPDRSTWETIKARSTVDPAEVTIFGVRLTPSKTLTSEGRIHISTSTDRVDASIFYRQVPLPFQTDERGFRKMKWRFGNIASYGKPSVLMQNLPTCASCHLFSRDGRLISMEMNYKKDSGAHFIAQVEKTIALSEKHFMTWSNFPKPDLLPPTRGTFAKLSPNGAYMVGTVNEISYFALTNDPAYCQLFFPTFGLLAWYSVDSRQFHRLPGADDPEFVQTDPSWSWDEKSIVFART